jgi:hypothetical protein
VQRRALGALFLGLSLALLLTAVATFVGSGGGAGRFVVAAAGLVLAVWLGSLALSALRG